MMNRMMLTSILGDDYRILEAGNGKQCLELLRAKAGQISLVLLDIPHLLKVLDEALK